MTDEITNGDTVNEDVAYKTPGASAPQIAPSPIVPPEAPAAHSGSAQAPGGSVPAAGSVPAPFDAAVQPPPPTQSLGADPIADEVGLKIEPRPHPGANLGTDIAQILQDVKLPPPRRVASEPAAHAAPVAPAAPPVGTISRMAPNAALQDSVPHAVTVAPLAAHTSIASTAPPAWPAPASTTVEPTAEESPSPVVSLHTMKSDLQTVVRSEKISVVRAASMEAQQRAHKPQPEKPVRSRRDLRKLFLTLAAILIFLALGGAALFAAYTLTQQNKTAPAAPASILFAEQQTVLPIDGVRPADLKQTLSNMLASQTGGAGSIMQIIPVVTGTSGSAQLATLQEFLSALGAKAPDDLLRALSSTFFFGIHAADVPAPVFVIPVVSYDHAFAGMLAWEPTMDTDLSPLFEQVSPYLPAASTSTLPSARTFQDAIMRNYDVRVLEDDAGDPVLYYSFPTQNILIIAASPYTFPEVLSRLQAQREL